MHKKLITILVMWIVTSPWIAFAQDQATAPSPTPDPLLVQGPMEAAHLNFQTLETGQLLISATDAEENPIKGLTADHFVIRQGPKTAKIISVEPLETSKEVGLNIVMVVDNSKSMQFREAVAPLMSALDAFFSTLRPIDNVSAVMFDDEHTRTVNGRKLHARVIQSQTVDQLREATTNFPKRLTSGTFLLDAMMVGFDLAKQMPPKSNKFMVVFSDGEDINSSVTPKEVAAAAQGVDNFSIYAVDYMPSKTMNPFLSRMATDHSGRVWKAASAEELLPVFQAFSSTLLHRYVVSYRFLEAPKGSLTFSVPELTIEEVTTIDSAPLLNQVYFDTGQSELSDRYALLTSQSETEAFDEKKLKGPMEKYQNLLNIIGWRMKNIPDATILLVGCNSNIGEEKNRTDLSRSRAESVKAYLRYVWGIDPKRMSVEQRNLPEMPSTNRIPEGQAENQRVEIYADNETILDTVDSAYIEKVSNLDQLKILPDIKSEAGISEYQVDIFCGDREIKTIKGQGALPNEWSVPLQASLLEEISGCRSVEMQMQVTDKDANGMGKLETAILPVNFVQRTQQLSQVQGYKVKEQYALILFDYDSAAIKAHNQTIMERIIGRIQQLPDATVSIVGHTDSIGSQEYNLDLSSRRAEAAKLAIIEAAADLNDRMQVSGVGPDDPIYDNQLPEGRSLNRTVTITLEYTQK